MKKIILSIMIFIILASCQPKGPAMANGVVIEQLTRDEIAEYGGDDDNMEWGNGFDPKWSPDGKYIAFLSGRGGVINIFLMDSDGKNQFPLTARTEDDPYIIEQYWTPDEKSLIFITVEDTPYQYRKIYRIDIEAAKARPLGENEWQLLVDLGKESYIFDAQMFSDGNLYFTYGDPVKDKGPNGIVFTKIVYLDKNDQQVKEYLSIPECAISNFFY